MPHSKNSNKKNVPTARFRKMVKTVVRTMPEVKIKESNATSRAFDAAPSGATVVVSLDNNLLGEIVQGSGAGNRIGDRIHLKSLDFKAVFVPTTSTVGAVRIIIGQVLDQDDSSSPTLTYAQVLNQLSGSADYSCITAGYDHEPLVSHRILSDEVITWDATNAAAPRLINYHFSRLALRNRNYDGTSFRHTGMFFYMLLSANGVAATLFKPSVKLRYTDM